MGEQRNKHLSNHPLDELNRNEIGEITEREEEVEMSVAKVSIALKIRMMDERAAAADDGGFP